MYVVKSTFKGYLDIGIGMLGPGAEAPLDQLNNIILAYQAAGRVMVTFKEGGVYTTPAPTEVSPGLPEPSLVASLSENPVVPSAPEGADEGQMGDGLFDSGDESHDGEQESTASRENAATPREGKHKGKRR